MKNINRWMPLLMVLLMAVILCTCVVYCSSRTLTNEDFIRLHIVANSDSAEDQALKLKVRDGLIEMINKELVRSTMEQADAEAETASLEIDGTRNYIQTHLEEIRQAAEKILRDEGCGDSVRVEFGVSWIPEKTYGNVTFPAGNYEALRVLIGNGDGKNWWCVLYPPLCLINTSCENEDQKELLQDAVMTPRYRQLTEDAASGGSTKTLRLRFRSLEALEKLTS